MARTLTNITLTTFDKSGKSTTTDISYTKLYEGRSPEEISAAEQWAKRVCDNIYGKW